MIGLFVGIESYAWTQADFQNLITFCQKYGVEQVVLKVYEQTQGEWYSGLGGAAKVVSLLQQSGLNVLPYGYLYGGSEDEQYVLKGLQQWGRFCANMETPFNNNVSLVQSFADALMGHPGQLFISTWADTQTQQWQNNISILDTLAPIWMPEVYSDALLKNLYSQFPATKQPIQPTFQIDTVDYTVALPYAGSDFTLWEYQLAQADPYNLTQFLQLGKGQSMSTYPTNSKGMVCNPCPVTEFQPGHSEFECGSFAIAILGRSCNYAQANTYSEANAIAWAEYEYSKQTGSNGPSNTIGISVDQMHAMLKDTQNNSISAGSEALHWWDTDISPTTTQDHDISTIKAALQHGYPVIATVSEASIIDLDLKKNPYWWGPSGNHILVWVGIASDGNLLACDPANVVEGDGNLQTHKTLQPWPRRYDITTVDNQWATIIQTPWLPPIPSGNPLTWAAYVPPAPTAPTPDGVTVTYDTVSNSIIFVDTKTSKALYRIGL